MHRDKANLDSNVANEVREQSANYSAPASSPSDSVQDSNTAMNMPPMHSVCRAFRGLGGSVSSFEAIRYPDQLRQQQELKLLGPLHSITPHNIPDDSPLSLIFVNFKNGVGKMLAQGTSLDEVLGPIDPVVDLIFRSRTPMDSFSACTWACELARTDVAVDIFTQLANAFLLSRFMRWHLAPSLKNYLLLPEIIPPTLANRKIPHFASADLYALPEVRDALILGNFDLLESIGTPGTQSIRFHWAFDMEKAINIDLTTGERTVSRLFAVCASEPSNWNCSKDFLVNSPMTKGMVNAIDHQHA